ncbi:DMT family transporter [Mycobacterium sp. SM1]|uniref:DMT family transporter n=1 Tax=Mycobacterium sp. SM1 TaxID=2816243 RepID=UPI001BCB28CD|nr:DMT family transporter [Mycobacterium sp. SM1]MBS4729988.1 DMT family transporter [Mycobacterium sp. SM1]
MSRADIAVSLALCAALAAAIGSVIRQRCAQEITERPVGPLALFTMLLRDTRWWLGGTGDIASYGLLAAALDKGSVMLVMALQVTALLFALPIYARITRHRITPREWLWAVLLAAALAVVVAVGQPKAGTSHGSLERWIVVAAVMGPLLGLCVLGARIWADRPAAAVLLAAVSGSSLALFAVLTKGLVEAVEHGALRVLHSAELYAWLLAGLAGMIYQQSAFRAGALTASLPTMTVAKPVVASVLGITVLGETLNADGAEWFALVVAAVVVIVATIALARGEAATMAAGAGRDVKIAHRPAAPSQP